MDEGKLLLLRPHDGTGRLVFGDTGDTGSGAPDADFSLDADLPGLGELALVYGAVAALDAPLEGDLAGDLPLVWDANVSRGGLRGELQSKYQDGQPVAAAVASRWQATLPMPTGLQARWQRAQPCHGALQPRWQQAQPLRAAVQQRHQAAEPLRGGARLHWQDAERLRGAVLQLFQEGQQRRGATRQHWQETLRLRGAVLHRYQEGERLRAAVRSHYEPALPVWIAQRQHWQDAMRPAAGMYVPPVVRPREPCYDPATLGRLVFTDLALGNGRLIFVCQRAGPGPQPGTVVVPIKRVYMTVNNLILVRASDGAAIPAYSLGMGLDVDSWTWSWQASLHASALPLIVPSVDGEPVEVLATVNSVPYRLLAEGYTRERSFGSTRISVRGRGLAAILDAPYAPTLNHGNTLARTAQQIMGDVLMINGVPMGWNVAWGLTDWLVPGNVWAHQGSYISALLDIAGAAGGYLQPHDTAQTLRVLPRYPAAPWNWTSLTPDFELPAAVVAVEGTDWQRKTPYNRVFVSGEQAGVLGQVTRAGTAGNAVAPMVTHPLITHADAARQRGIAVLADTGLQAHISLRLPVLAETGLIKPGALVRYVDGATTHLGLVRATSLEWRAPQLRQTLTVETHPS